MTLERREKMGSHEGWEGQWGMREIKKKKEKILRGNKMGEKAAFLYKGRESGNWGLDMEGRKINDWGVRQRSGNG